VRECSEPGFAYRYLTPSFGADVSTGSSVLDHDTNVFFALPATGDDASLYSLDLSSVTNQATGGAISWEEVTKPNFKMNGRQPVMSQASNHIGTSR